MAYTYTYMVTNTITNEFYIGSRYANVTAKRSIAGKKGAEKQWRNKNVLHV
jgi:hypothetical protein